jgi:hypothetical protein
LYLRFTLKYIFNLFYVKILNKGSIVITDLWREYRDEDLNALFIEKRYVKKYTFYTVYILHISKIFFNCFILFFLNKNNI